MEAFVSTVRAAGQPVAMPVSVVTADTTVEYVVTHYARRMAVLMLLANGYSSKEIAQLLLATKKIVDNDVLWWQNRLGARSRTQVAALAVDSGVLCSRDLRFDGTLASLGAFIARQTDDPRYARGLSLVRAR